MKNKIIFIALIFLSFNVIMSKNDLKKYLIEFTWGDSLPKKTHENDSVMNLIISEFKNCDSIYIAASVCYGGRLSESHSWESADSIK